MCVHRSLVAHIVTATGVGGATRVGSIRYFDEAFSAGTTFLSSQSFNFGSLDYVVDHCSELCLHSGAVSHDTIELKRRA